MRIPLDCVAMAGIGGITPILLKLATSALANPGFDLPGTGYYIGLSLFFFISAVLAYAFAETNIRQAFILGLTAPAVITNIAAGLDENRASSEGSQSMASVRMSLLKVMTVPSTSCNTPWSRSVQ